jgi:hypothetical protein
MTVAIRLDRSRPFSECRGDRTPDDPHYKVHYWQGGRLGKDIILLPFDAGGQLVPDDGKTAPWTGLVEGKQVQFHPLWNDKMREFLKLKAARLTQMAGDQVEEDPISTEAMTEALAEEVNLQAWLRGEARYAPHLLRAAAKKRFSKNYPQIKELVVDLVLDEKLVPEDEVCNELRVHLPGKAA